MLPDGFTSDGLNGKPFNWAGKKIRSKRTGEVYTVREVLKGGKVMMERRWMLYASDLPTIRDNYEVEG
jgi:hypothetical protein